MSSTGLLTRAPVQRVRTALRAAGSDAEVIALRETARTAADAARALGVEVGAIVKSLVFLLDGEPVLALVAGDRRCVAEALPEALGRPDAQPARADADAVRAATGFTIGGVAPLGHAEALPTALDPSLARFPRIYAAAGHPHCVFATTFDELVLLTGGRADGGIAA